ncbi:metallophosphoesterase family protein [Candidatus Bipolaricaulota bacterium]|nr:metallophosphoesterase family protein [Candidatus Bipolaricaulota bacterium]
MPGGARKSRGRWNTGQRPLTRGPGYCRTAPGGEGNELGRATLAGLTPGTRYAYRVRLGQAVSPVCYFTVPPEEFRPFTFLVYGDSRTNYDLHALVAERMAEETAEFVVHTGDLIESPTQREWREFFSTGSPLFRAMSFLCIIGNHERNSRTYYELFSLPAGGGRAGEQWWSLNWGEVLLVGLDSNLQYLKLTGLREETDWLREVLAQDARYKFVFFHHPLYSSDAHYGGNESLGTIWAPIFQEAGVTAVFVGHCHNYEHVIKDGVQYFITGGGGAPLYPLSEERIEGSVLGIEDTLHYLRVTVAEDGARVEMIPVARVEGGQVIPLPPEPMETVELAPIPVPTAP